jgi:hypothetical protein
MAAVYSVRLKGGEKGEEGDRISERKAVDLDHRQWNLMTF